MFCKNVMSSTKHILGSNIKYIILFQKFCCVDFINSVRLLNCLVLKITQIYIIQTRFSYNITDTEKVICQQYYQIDHLLLKNVSFN